ncbi:MAG: pitrilysin family protein [Capsulimonas sp.]|uniref:M16 family metallopeptidase n=1 Tax=Capsulimonas sp. TaxID=2494211 RepID=UPI003267265E
MSRTLFATAACALLWISSAAITHAQTAEAPAASAPEPAAAQPSAIYRTTLPSGMKIVCRQEAGAPLVAVNVFVTVGSGLETSQNAGIGSFVARTLLASTSIRSQQTIQGEIADLGGSFDVSRQPDWTRISALCVSDHFPNMIDLLTDVLKNATFDTDVVEERRADVLSDINDSDAGLFTVTYNGVRSRLFASSGYALPAVGTTKSIQRITRRQIQQYYLRYYVPQNMTVSVVGDIAPEDAVREITHGMADYQSTVRGTRRVGAPLVELPVLSGSPEPFHSTMSDLTQICVMSGFRAPSMSNPDYFALQVANALLGGMKTSRMFTNLREKQGLAYDLGSFYSPQLYSGDLTAYVFAAARPSTDASANTEAIAKIRQLLLDQITDLQMKPATDTEINRAKHYLIGSQKIKHERIEDRSYLLGLAEISSNDKGNLDEEFTQKINAVTSADVQRVAKKYFAHPAIAVVEPDSKNGGVVLR